MNFKLKLFYLILFVFSAIAEKTNQSKNVFTWPLPSYTQAQDLISNGNSGKAIQLLKKEMSGLFPFRFQATNGYKIYFYYYKLLGDAYSAADNPVEAIEAYRLALSPVPLSIITNFPIPYAKCLYGLGKQFMKIGRLADAETILMTALKLAQNDRLSADYYWVKAVRTSSLGDNDSAAKFAAKCVEFAPDYNWAAWHKLAHSKYASGKRVEAVDEWLDGLAAFKLALPIVDVPNYLNRALPYWKSATDEQIIRYYEILKELVTCNAPNSKNEKAITRLLTEKLKLEKLFPKLISSTDAKSLLAKSLPFKKAFKTDETKFIITTNKNYKIPDYLLIGNETEKIINKALLSESKHKTEKTKDLYKEVLSKINKTNEEIFIQGYSPEYFALAHLGFLYAELEDENEGMREKALEYERMADGLVVSNYEDVGVSYCPEEYYRLLMSKGGMAKRSGFHDECFSAWRRASEIAPNSLDPKQCLLKHEADLAHLNGDIQTVAEKMEEFFKLPLERPWYKYWYDQAYIYWQLNNMNLWKDSESPTKKAIDTMLDGFEIGIFDFSCHWAEFCNANFSSLENFDIYKDILNNLKTLNSPEVEYKRLYKLTKRFGLIIPATPENACIMSSTIKCIRDLSAIDRNEDIRFIFYCNTKLSDN